MALIDVNDVVSTIRGWTGGLIITYSFREQPDGGGGLQQHHRVVIDGAITTEDSLLQLLHTIWVAAGSP